MKLKNVLDAHLDAKIEDLRIQIKQRDARIEELMRGIENVVQGCHCSDCRRLRALLNTTS